MYSRHELRMNVHQLGSLHIDALNELCQIRQTHIYCARLRLTDIIVAFGIEGSTNTTSLTYAVGGSRNICTDQNQSVCPDTDMPAQDLRTDRFTHLCDPPRGTLLNPYDPLAPYDTRFRVHGAIQRVYRVNVGGIWVGVLLEEVEECVDRRIAAQRVSAVFSILSRAQRDTTYSYTMSFSKTWGIARPRGACGIYAGY